MSHETLTIPALGTALRHGELDCADLTRQCLDRIEQFESRIRAWVSVDREGAMRRATQLDEELAQGRDRGALHGIPIGIKDLFDVKGWPTRAGSALSDPAPAAGDCTVVAKLRAAGAVILGKTITTEWASFDPPPTRNPWDAARTPGGSSSGSAAAVSLGMCVAALGSQTGGSITRPAIYCGVAGCKPTWGRVSVRGVAPLSPNLDHPGPIARNVADLAAVMQTIAGYDKDDPWSVNKVVDAYRATSSQSSAPRIGWLREFFDDEADADSRAAIETTVGRLKKAGARVVELTLPDCFKNVIAWHRTIMAVEAAYTHRQLFPARRDEFGPNIARLLDDGVNASNLAYVEALQGQRIWRRETARLLADVDCLLTPAATSAAPADLTITGDPRFNSVWSLAGAPTVSIPTALSPAGMPLGIQLVGRRWHEAALFGVAAWCERTVAFDARPPGLA